MCHVPGVTKMAGLKICFVLGVMGRKGEREGGREGGLTNERPGN